VFKHLIRMVGRDLIESKSKWKKRCFLALSIRNSSSSQKGNQGKNELKIKVVVKKCTFSYILIWILYI